jgi:short-subunit dehydrogenase
VDLVGEHADACARSLGDRSTSHVMDVSDPAAWEALAVELRRAHGGVDILVNNAGISILGPFADQTVSDIDRIVGVNLKGALYGCRALLPDLARGGGHIVNIASLAGHVPFPYQSTYCATKYALVGFSASLRMELSARGVGVTAVSPGAVATRLLESAASYDASASSKLVALMLAYGIRADRVAARIVTAIERDEAEVLIGWDARVATVARAVAPGAWRLALARGFGWRVRAREKNT